MRTIIMREFHIDAAHFIPSHPGKCQRLHGHTYRVEVFAQGPVNHDRDSPEYGMVVDFAKIAHAFDEVVAAGSDHSLLNDVYPEIIPTVENLATCWLGILHDAEPRIFRVRVWEGQAGFAEVEL